MKAAFFSLFALATAAIASPVPQAVNPTPDTAEVKSAVDSLNKILEIAGVEEIVDKSTKGSASPIKRDITDITQLLSVLQSGASGIKDKTSGFEGIADKVSAGDLTKAEGAEKAIPGLEGVNFELTNIVTKLTGAAGLPVANGDVDKVLNLVVILVTEVLTAVKTIVTVTGLQPQLISVLHSVFQILAKVLTLVIGLVAGLLPGLIAALSPLLAGLGTGVLAPLLTPVVALLAGLGAGI
ncbi:hypothetical protein NW768_009633 [Fusarium equiseti]|uniref:Uncharacterized protein n=1 Tax=Fusarium equiseti TaxID=61235 RepID=A0ABQ8R2U2_FUSEQ|nr:hypothetical protein NW768_009633 [Fusarium equiseti]